MTQKKKTKAIHIVFDARLHKLIKKRAEENYLPITAFVRQAVRRALSQAKPTTSAKTPAKPHVTEAQKNMAI